MTAEEETAEAVEEEAEEDAQAGWGAGIDKFEFRNSKLVLKNFVEDDELEIEIDHLFLTLFHTWAPDQPSNSRGSSSAGSSFRRERAR